MGGKKKYIEMFDSFMEPLNCQRPLTTSRSYSVTISK